MPAHDQSNGPEISNAVLCRPPSGTKKYKAAYSRQLSSSSRALLNSKPTTTQQAWPQPDHQFQSKSQTNCILPGNENHTVGQLCHDSGGGKTETQQTDKLTKAANEGRRRPVSAHVSRTSHFSVESGDTGKKQRPVSAKLCRSGVTKGTEHTAIYKTDTENSIPSSAHDLDGDSNVTGGGTDLLKPHVYGYTAGKTVFGKDLVTNPVQKNCPTESIWKDSTTAETSLSGRKLPSCLEPLRSWLTEDVPPDLFGISHSDCLVFLPGLQGYDELPVVPPTQSVDEDLAYLEKIEEPKPWKPKKYKHPFKIIPLEEHKCNHTGKRVPPLKILAEDGTLLHETWRGKRTADVVRKEIQELEDLLNGMGTDTDSCIIAQYQADLNRLQTQINSTLPRVQEIEMREEEKARKNQPTDMCGLRAFYKQHDIIINHIRKQHERCVKELAMLEADVLETERRHFSMKR